MSAPETATKFAPTQSSSVLGGQIVGRSERAAAPPAALKLRLDLNLEVEIAIQAKVNGDITLSLLDTEWDGGQIRAVMKRPAQFANYSPVLSLSRPLADVPLEHPIVNVKALIKSKD
ncbi:uncharacterized protein ARMOST_19650 [Armillaria ostoyae]|uniref:Uncharacterized protein n=1 Tax=Armillaria ostoyae TaxID=47428 RepID=A0A284S545_ARMOS|nr:uncharacterized protein ARMOST_19650 [Armillaria ostoyae]